METLPSTMRLIAPRPREPSDDRVRSDVRGDGDDPLGRSTADHHPLACSAEVDGMAEAKQDSRRINRRRGAR